MKRIVFALCFLITLCAFFASCEDTPDVITTKTITLSSTNITMDAGDKLALTAKTEPAAWTDAEIFWSSSSPEIATIDENGVIYAKSVGQCVIKAYTADGISAATTVTVRAGAADLVNIEVQNIGKTLNYIAGDEEAVVSSAVVEDYEFLCEYLSATRVNITVTLKGRKTYDVDGEAGENPVVFEVMAHEKNNPDAYNTSVLSKKDIKVGEEFVISYSFAVNTDGKTQQSYYLTMSSESEWVDVTSLINFRVEGLGADGITVDYLIGNEVATSVRISDYVLEYVYFPAEDGNQAFVYVTVRFTGQKTYDSDGAQSITPGKFYVHLFRDDGIFCETFDASTEKVTVNGEFDQASFSFKAGVDGSTERYFYVKISANKDWRK